MRRYLLVTYDFPPSFGGIAAYYKGLVDHFPDGKIAVFTVRREREVDLGVPTFRVRERGISRYYTWYDGMKEIHNQFPFDVILCGNFSVLSYPVFLFHKSFGVPYFLFFHGNDILRVHRNLKLNPLKRLMLFPIFKCTAGVVANSQFTCRLVDRVFPLRRKNTLVLHPGVADEFLGIRGRAAPFSRGTITLLTVARLAWRKGIHIVVKALSLLSGDFPVRYEVVGRGNKAPLEELIRRIGMEGRVTLRGFVGGEELMDIYRNADIFVMPSLYDGARCEVEGFGIAFLEANAFALPVLGSRTGGIPEAVLDGVTGRLVPQDFTEEDVADVLRWMIEHRDESIEMGMHGYERVNRDFSYTKKASELIAFAEDAVECMAK